MRVKLRALLNSRGITQAELAQATGIRPSTISQLCNNIAFRAVKNTFQKFSIIQKK